MSTIKPREAEYVIYQGDDLPRIAELRQALEVARRQAERSDGPLRIGDEAPAVDEAESNYREFVLEAAERAIVVRLQAIGRRRFRDLMAAHPPRKIPPPEGETGEERTHPEDAPYAVDTETFPDALLRYVDEDDDSIRTIVSPDLTPAKLRAFVDDEISEGDFEGMWLAAYYLNRSPGADPKAVLSLTASRSSSET